MAAAQPTADPRTSVGEESKEFEGVCRQGIGIGEVGREMAMRNMQEVGKSGKKDDLSSPEITSFISSKINIK